MLDNWDRALGLNWPAYYRWSTAWPELLPYGWLAYGGIVLPAIWVPVTLGLTNNLVRLHRYTMATLLSLVAVSFISALVPAIGTYQLYDLPTEFATYKATGYLIQLARLPMIRSGDLDVLHMTEIGGIVTFPSFHAGAAVLALWGWWGVWWMRPPALMMCLAMLVATPLFGGHYFVDVFAGAFVSGLAIAATSLMDRRRPGMHTKEAVSLPIAPAEV
nr:phosphatase PAP2 family protein [Bradyrhizobium diazoefficiens]